MSVFTSLVTKVLLVPRDPENTITIRKLAPKHLAEARKASQRESMSELKDMGPAFVKEVQQLVQDGTAGNAAAADPLLLFDRPTLMRHGVINWTYEQPRAQEAFEDLDEETADWLAREILTLAKPSLFQTTAEGEADQKNA